MSNCRNKCIITINIYLNLVIILSCKISKLGFGEI